MNFCLKRYLRRGAADGGFVRRAVIQTRALRDKIAASKRKGLWMGGIHCILEGVIVGREWVVRHRCHNRMCVNPEHLAPGTQADNERDDWEYWAGGVDRRFL